MDLIYCFHTVRHLHGITMRLYFGSLYQSSGEMQLNSIILSIPAFTEACQYQLLLFTRKGTAPGYIKTPFIEVIGPGKEI